jgi:caa(3)-type oxidase subunit IV
MDIPMATPVSDPLKEQRGEALRLVGALTLLVLLALASWGLAHTHLGRAEALVALGIAALKACIVALTFMELSKSGLTMKFIVVLVPMFIALICGLVYSDVALR